MHTDPYTANAEWYGALTVAWQEPTDIALRSILGRIDGGSAVDIGAGTGACLPLLRTLGAERLVAVEPSRSMRAGLVATLATDPDLLARTTVVREPFPAAVDRLPARWHAAVMLNAIGHLSDDDRAHLWRTVADRLIPGGRFAVALQPPERAMAIAWTDFGAVNIGDDQVITRGKAEPLDAHHVEWTMEWTLTDPAGRVLERRTASHRWRTLSADDLTAEAQAHGLTRVNAPNAEPLCGFQQP